MRPGWLIAEVWRAVGSSVRRTMDRQVGPHEGYCPDWLAAFLGTAGLAFLFLVIVNGFWELSR